MELPSSPWSTIFPQTESPVDLVEIKDKVQIQDTNALDILNTDRPYDLFE